MRRREHARALGNAGVDGVAQSDVDEVLGADVAHRREARRECAPRVLRTIERLLGRETHHAVVDAAVVVLLELRGQVRVRIDEAWQQCGVSEVDHARAGRRGSRADRHDAVAAHHDRGAVFQRRAGGVEHVCSAQHDGLGRTRGLLGNCARCRDSGEGGDCCET